MTASLDPRDELAAAAAHAAAQAESGMQPHEPKASRAKLKKYGLRTLVLLFMLNLIDEFDRAVLAVALDDIRREFGLSDAAVGLLPAAVIFITGIVALPVGHWCDRGSRKKILAAGAIIWGTAGLLAAMAQNFAQLFATRALLGFGQGTIGPTHLSILSDTYPQSVRGRVLGYHRSANPAGQVLGALIGGLIIGAFGWRWGFILAGLALWLLREPKHGEADLQQLVDDDPMVSAFLAEPADRLTFRQSLGRIWRIRTLRYCIFANATFGFALFGMVFFLPTYFERMYGMSVEQAGAVQALIAMGTFIGTWLGGPLADRNLTKGFGALCRYGCLAALILAVSWPIAFAVPVAGVTITLLAVSSLLSSLAVPGVVAVIAAAAPPRIRAQTFSCFGLALSVCGAASAPILIGLLSDALQRNGFSDADALRWSMCGLVAVVMALGTFLIVQASRHAEADVNATITEFLESYNAVPG
jgi:MFS family permease